MAKLVAAGWAASTKAQARPERSGRAFAFGVQAEAERRGERREGQRKARFHHAKTLRREDVVLAAGLVNHPDGAPKAKLN